MSSVQKVNELLANRKWEEVSNSLYQIEEKLNTGDVSDLKGFFNIPYPEPPYWVMERLTYIGEWMITHPRVKI